MNQIKRVCLLVAAGSFLLAGQVRAEDKAAASAAPAAKAVGPTTSAMKAAGELAAEGKTDEAIAAYEKIGVLPKPKAEAWRLNNEGLAYLIATTPAPEKALPLLEKAVATDDSNYVAWNNLGTAYEQTDELDKAKDAYQKSVDAAKAAEADSSKAEANLTALTERMDRIQAKKDKAAAKAAGKPVASAKPAAPDEKK